MTTSSYSYSTSQYPSMQLGNVIQVGNTTQTGNTLQTGESELHGSSTIVGYLTLSDTLYVEARNVVSTGNGFQLAHGGILMDQGSINNNYCCQMVKFSAQLLASGAYRKITGLVTNVIPGFDNRLTGMGDTANSQILIQKTGKYILRGQCYGQTAATGGYTLVFGINGSVDDSCYAQDPTTLADWCAQIMLIRELPANSTVQLFAGVVSSANLGGVGTFQGFYLSACLID